jgi:uncharacterized repeat protein (TIGR03803 family)
MRVAFKFNRPRNMPNAIVWVAASCLALLPIGCGGGGTNSVGPQQVSVPNVVGDTQATAKSTITGDGLIVGPVTMQASSTVLSGNVISETPAAGTMVPPGSAVSLAVSTGPATYPVTVSVAGLVSGQSVTVLDNGTDSLTFQSNSSQQFATLLPLNAAYSVSVSIQPVIESCSVSGGAGQVTGPVSVSVSCALAPQSVTYPAFTAPYPLVRSGVSPAVVIASPRIVPVFFSNSPDRAATISYLQALAASPEWTVLTEYRVGPATIGAPVYLTSAAPATTTLNDIDSYIAATASSWATLDGSEMFVLYYPSSTNITDLHVGGWHSTTLTGPIVPYVLIPSHNQATDFYVQFHEIAEEATDPLPGRGYWGLNSDFSSYYSYLGNMELADLCELYFPFYSTSFGQMAGIWSNAAVNAGQFPCTTAGSSNLGATFTAYPVLPSTYYATPIPGDTNASVGIAPGQSVTIPINVSSYGPLEVPISLSVTQLNTNAAKTNVLTFALDQTQALNGSVVHLTITAPSTPLSTTTGYASFLVRATVPPANNNIPQAVYPGMVTEPGASCGTAAFSLSGSGESVVHSFGASGDGGAPFAGLIQGTDGNLYGTSAGTTALGLFSADAQYGTVFRMTPAGAVTTLHTFADSDGKNPVAALVQASDGNFYGTTGGGGQYGWGTVFQITPSGAFTSLHAFVGESDGGFPGAGLVQGSDGSLYGTTSSGAPGLGTVFKITTAGVLTTLHSFAGSDGSAPVAALTLADGNFYGTTSAGGAHGMGSIFKITPGGALTTLYSFHGSDGATPTARLTQAPGGNFYGSTYAGGTANLGTVFQITPAGALTTLHSFTGTDGSNPRAGVVLDANGNLYGTASGGGGGGLSGVTGNVGIGTVFELSPTGTILASYSFQMGTYQSPVFQLGIDAENPSGDLLHATDGHFYGTAASAGGCNVGGVFRFL